ncbi:MAG TPA: hypothetical protein VMB02_05070 [Candidatus Aquilonibacter sp.]|nr:hypothetical protein [Candidatus Aquilonibacter sp.]
MATAVACNVLVADEVWLVTALLHREQPDRSDFTIKEIVQRAKREGVGGRLRPGVYVHVVQHCVANRTPNTGRYRMLFETRKNYRRLFRPGDPYDARREGSKTMPDRGDVPAKYHSLLDWYGREYVPRSRATAENDPLLALRGSGKRLWADEHADEYVRRLREGWE